VLHISPYEARKTFYLGPSKTVPLDNCCSRSRTRSRKRTVGGAVVHEDVIYERGSPAIASTDVAELCATSDWLEFRLGHLDAALGVSDPLPLVPPATTEPSQRHSGSRQSSLTRSDRLVDDNVSSVYFALYSLLRLTSCVSHGKRGFAKWAHCSSRLAHPTRHRPRPPRVGCAAFCAPSPAPWPRRSGCSPQPPPRHPATRTMRRSRTPCAAAPRSRHDPPCSPLQSPSLAVICTLCNVRYIV